MIIRHGFLFLYPHIFSVPSPILYENLPVYARFLDEAGVLEHICNAIQIEIDAANRRLESLEYIFSPDTAPEEWLLWLQQIVGGAAIGDRWLGLGINPEWNAADQRKLIRSLWKYWQAKGTQWGIREGMSIWLRWSQAHDTDRCQINAPFGRNLTDDPPGWWGWGTDYGDFRTRTWIDIKRLGSGSYTQTYQPPWLSVRSPGWQWDYGQQWSDRSAAIKFADPGDSTGSAMGPGHSWVHVFPTVEKWNQIFPDVFELNPEIWSIHAQPTIFGWFDGGETEPILLQRSQDTPPTQTTLVFEPSGFQWGDMYPF